MTNRLRRTDGIERRRVAPSNTAGHHALLLINPHTSFFFRAKRRWSARKG
jgi:hypothetical protein